jgi:hypothetical protein
MAGTLSYVVVVLASLMGVAATITWWERADHAG